MKGQLIDNEVSACDSGSLALERAMRFTNGTGDDLADCVRESLGLSETLIEEDESFADPLEILIQAEELGLI